MQGLNTSADQMIRTLGDYVKALHLHDNDLVIDRHQIPFSMSIDFDKIVRALKDISYNGYFTLEADSYVTNSEKDVKEILSDLYNVAKRLAEKFENLK